MNQLQNLAATGRDRMESRHLADHLGEAASRRFCRCRRHLGEAASRRFAWWARSPSARPMWPPRPCKGGASRPGEPRPYRTSTTTLKNRIAAFSSPVAPSTAFQSPSRVAQ